MIPKIIHYCWFGGKEKPAKVQKCIASWKSLLKDYRFIEWNEQNFDISSLPYVKQAYDAGKYAFVSDVARMRALEIYGGIYMDTDVEVLRSFDSLLDHRCLLGFEEKNFIATSFFAAEPGHPLVREFFRTYEQRSFSRTDGSLDMTTNVQKLTAILEGQGLVRNGEFQLLKDGIAVYPQEYFSPYDYINCIHQNTPNTYCVHHYFVTWLPLRTRLKKAAKRFLVKIIGKKNLMKLRTK